MVVTRCDMTQSPSFFLPISWFISWPSCPTNDEIAPTDIHQDTFGAFIVVVNGVETWDNKADAQHTKTFTLVL